MASVRSRWTGVLLSAAAESGSLLGNTANTTLPADLALLSAGTGTDFEQHNSNDKACGRGRADDSASSSQLMCLHLPSSEDSAVLAVELLDTSAGQPSSGPGLAEARALAAEAAAVQAEAEQDALYVRAAPIGQQGDFTWIRAASSAASMHRFTMGRQGVSPGLLSQVVQRVLRFISNDGGSHLVAARP